MLLEAVAILPEQHVLKGMFRKVQLRPSEQTFHNFQLPSRVYLRFSSLKTTSKLAHVGSTTQTVAAREATRFRKFQQLKNERMVSVELSLRYWVRQDNFWDWAALPITSPVPNEVLLGREHATIQDLQPALNFPFIQRWFCPRRSLPTMPGSHILWDSAEFFANSERLRPDQEGFFSLLESRPFSNFPVFVIEKKCDSCCAIWAATHQSGSKPKRRFEPMSMILLLYAAFAKRVCVCQFICRFPLARPLTRLCDLKGLSLLGWRHP